MTDPRNHYCEAPACREWGSFGFAVGKAVPLIWFCAAHRHLGAERLAPAKVGPEQVPHVLDQGRLF